MFEIDFSLPILSLLTGSALLFAGCHSAPKSELRTDKNSRLATFFDIQGHRGARGLLPENTIPAFLKALELGVTTLELDLAVSNDRKLVVSHEPWFSSEICSKPNGEPIAPADERAHLIYQMNYSEISAYDCGRRGHPRFPTQKPMQVCKPLFQDVVKAAEAYVQEKNLPAIFYNIETKCTPEGDNRLHPAPAEFVEILLREIRLLKIESRTIVQSFDVRTLQEMRRLAPNIRLALLVENNDTLEKNLEKLGFVPEIYSPDAALVNAALISAAHEKKMLVIPWTVNEPDTMTHLAELGADGIITDYPDRAHFLLEK
ncbi:glycerophosphoryl diester phosphodiesterase [Chloroherpeton thalassium ATCC 35110]|uniref:Glycerophosphoryl diester phosphodiesterase n=1 Tax=Chloroherpeton thalassium (strain ATCC 35110 / GB-78) TaxID=517418 RepID=B3QV92_CHLT3|nr:glycerophosphodiester phosphodiesterase [Chloroherpeton thalassium]ACF13046.1 glycerophosphoryl diester phosphodiesterase [Chloroherpeton thalassium ATCC 35110]